MSNYACIDLPRQLNEDGQMSWLWSRSEFYVLAGVSDRRQRVYLWHERVNTSTLELYSCPLSLNHTGPDVNVDRPGGLRQWHKLTEVPTTHLAEAQSIAFHSFLDSAETQIGLLISSFGESTRLTPNTEARRVRYLDLYICFLSDGATRHFALDSPLFVGAAYHIKRGSLFFGHTDLGWCFGVNGSEDLAELRDLKRVSVFGADTRHLSYGPKAGDVGLAQPEIEHLQAERAAAGQVERQPDEGHNCLLSLLVQKVLPDCLQSCFGGGRCYFFTKTWSVISLDLANGTDLEYRLSPSPSCTIELNRIVRTALFHSSAFKSLLFVIKVEGSAVYEIFRILPDRERMTARFGRIGEFLQRDMGVRIRTFDDFAPIVDCSDTKLVALSNHHLVVCAIQPLSLIELLSRTACM